MSSETLRVVNLTMKTFDLNVLEKNVNVNDDGTNDGWKVWNVDETIVSCRLWMSKCIDWAEVN